MMAKTQARKPAPTQAPSATPIVSAPRGTVRSMTGYGRAALEDGQRVTAEIRAVNGRFLKLGVKLPGRYGALEDRVKTLLNEQGIRRGSVDVSLFFDGVGEDETSYGINEKIVGHYAAQARAASKKHKLKGDVPLSSLLSLPGVVKREERNEDIEDVWKISKAALLAAIEQFNLMRAREGAAMVADLRLQLAKLTEHRTRIESDAPEALKAGIQKYKDRIAKLLEQHSITAPLNPDVLEREVVLMADRTDVSEELARLSSHFEQMEGTLAEGGEVGKKLDFLTQELFREVNTIGSKTNENQITHRVVDMKGLIEKIREQVQNLE
jgi:uncharacterized protein (TIGR00255 family)